MKERKESTKGGKEEWEELAEKIRKVITKKKIKRIEIVQGKKERGGIKNAEKARLTISSTSYLGKWLKNGENDLSRNEKKTRKTMQRERRRKKKNGKNY